MTDVVSKQTRSRMMAGIKGKDSRPEMLIRLGLHQMGFRYRLHDVRLPGRPDLVFPKYKAVILVNGCFWHRHECGLFRWPSTRNDFWREKLEGNAVRDKINHRALKKLGWRVLIVWECAVKGRERRQEREVIETAAAWLQYDLADSQILGKRARSSSGRIFC